jgi:hypothetical protein
LSRILVSYCCSHTFEICRTFGRFICSLYVMIFCLSLWWLISLTMSIKERKLFDFSQWGDTGEIYMAWVQLQDSPCMIFLWVLCHYRFFCKWVGLSSITIHGVCNRYEQLTQYNNLAPQLGNELLLTYHFSRLIEGDSNMWMFSYIIIYFLVRRMGWTRQCWLDADKKCILNMEHMKGRNFLGYLCVNAGLSHVWMWLQTGFGLMIRFIVLFYTACDYTLQFTVTHTHTHTLVPTIMSSLAVAR